MTKKIKQFRIFPNHLEWQTMVNDKQWVMTDKRETVVVVKDRQQWMTHNVQCQTWWMTDNGEWQTMVNDGQTLVNDIKLWMTANG